MATVNRSVGFSACIEFVDARSERIHAELQANDDDGSYKKDFESLTHQPLESPLNTAVPACKFTIQSVLAVEVYSASDRMNIRQSLLQIARRVAKRDKRKLASLEADIHRAISKTANGKKSRSFQHIADFVVDAESELFHSYTIRIESIGHLLIRIFFLITPSVDLHSRITKISECQTNTRVQIKQNWLNWPIWRRTLSFTIEKGNTIKRALIKELDDDILMQVYSIVKRDIPGILTRNYMGIPVLTLYSSIASGVSSLASMTSYDATHSEFLRLVATSGVDDHDVYENPSTNDIYIEQKRRDEQNLKVLGKYIVASTGHPRMAERILWINSLKEILQIQSSNLDDLQNQSIMMSIQKTRRSLHAQRLQLHQNSSVYDLITSSHDQEQEFDQRDGESIATDLMWEPWPGKTFEYYSYGLESVKWHRDQIAEQIPRVKEAYQLARDEFSDHTLLILQRWAICLAIAVPIFMVGLERSLNYFYPIDPPSSTTVKGMSIPNLDITPLDQGSSELNRKNTAESTTTNTKSPLNKPLQRTAPHK